MAALLDILDSDLRLWNGGKILSSPGYALLEGGGYQFGAAARASARRQPRNINTRYWWQLSTRPLQPALGPARHTADLVHAHLLDLHRAAGSPDEVVLAVPDSLQRDQLSLLLGIIGTCPFAAVGLVNRSLLLTEKHALPGTIYHLELQLHQALLTRLSSADGELRIVESHVLPTCGLLALQEGIVELVAAAFINNTRFDPRRKAESEQQLYDSLGDALRALQTGEETAFEIEGYRTRMRAEDLRVVSDRLFNAAMGEISRAEGEPLIVLDPLAALLPGLQARFAHSRLADTADLYEAFGRYGEKILQPPDALHLVKGLPVAARVGDRPRAPAADVSRAPPPTHVLHNGRARALAANGVALAAGWKLEAAGTGWVLAGGSGMAKLNGADYRGGILAPGDSITLDGQGTWQLIEVLG